MNLSLQDVREALSKAVLPSFPEVVTAVERELARPEPSVRAVSELVEQDPPLAARFLGLANSSFYSRGHSTSDVFQAVSRLGLAEARQVVLATALLSQFGKLGGADPHRFWVHSLTTALLTRSLAQLSPIPLPKPLVSAAYLAGLLHDIGALALAHLFPEVYDPIVEEVAASGRASWEVEVERLGFHHGEVGELLVQFWALPPAIYASVRFHHEPWAAPRPVVQLIRLVYIADFVASNQGYERIEGVPVPEFEPGAWDGLGLDLTQVQEILSQAIAQGTRSEGLWQFVK